MSKVTVGCKLPTGITIKVDAVSVILNGTNSSNVIGGYGLTQNVDKTFMEEWLERNKGIAMVRKGFVFIQKNEKEAVAKAKDNAENDNGMEAMDPEKPGKGLESADGDGNTAKKPGGRASSGNTAKK